MKKHVLIAVPLLAFAVIAVIATVFFLDAGQAELPASVAQPAVDRLPTPSQPSAGSDSVVVDSRSLADCVADLTRPESSSRLMAAQRRRHIENFLEGQGSPLEQALAADIAGYRREIRLPADGGLPVGMVWTYGPPSSPAEHDLTARQQRELTERLNDAGIEGLIALDAPALLRGGWDDTTLVGHLIREHREALFAALPAADGALAVGLHERGFAIQEGVALANFVALVDVANVDLSETWWNGANLAKMAAIHGRPDILRYLTSNGVAATASRAWGRPGSVFDDIASMPERLRKATLADVAEQLIAAGDRPYLPSTLATFNDRLPDVSMPALHPDAAAALLVPALTEAARTVAAMDAEWMAKVDGASVLEQRCEERLAAAEPTAEMFHGTDLASKQRHREVLEKRKERWLKELEEMAAAEIGDAGVEDDAAYWIGLRTPLLEATWEGRWQEALAIADQLGQNAHSVLLDIALGADAPVDVLVAAVGRNGALPENAIAYLAGNGRSDLVEVVEALVPLGLDIHHVDELGRNAFHVLAERDWEEESKWRLAEYLAGRSVSVKPSAMGLDPLDRVLMQLLRTPRWGSRARIRFARFLIDQGAPLESSHFELAESLSQASERAYRALLRSVPELAS